MERNLKEKTMTLNADDMIEAIKLYCDKHNIIYDEQIIC
jgi:hypothetical protein